MTDKERQETLKRLKARLECDKRQVRGNADICNPPYMCEECDLCYAQGTLGERNIDLERAIEAISVEAIPVEWLVDVGRQGLVFAHNDEREGHIIEHDGIFECFSGALAAQVIQNILALWEAENGK